MTKFSVNEIFGPTLQGEGAVIGLPTHFVRLNGCDYRCRWCDTLDAVLPKRIILHNTSMTAKAILWRIQELDTSAVAKWITLSGGNPAIHSHLDELIDLLHHEGYGVCLETQGTICQPWFNTIDRLVFSPKPPSSGMKFDKERFGLCIRAARVGIEPRRRISIKVVVFDREDLEFAAGIFHSYDSLDCFLQAGDDSSLIGASLGEEPRSLEEMANSYLKLWELIKGDPRFGNVRLLPQLHKWIFGHGRGV